MGAKKTPRYASVEATAEYLGLTTDAVRKHIRTGTIRAYRFGPRLIRIDLNEIAAEMEVIEPTECPTKTRAPLVGSEPVRKRRTA